MIDHRDTNLTDIERREREREVEREGKRDRVERQRAWSNRCRWEQETSKEGDEGAHSGPGPVFGKDASATSLLRIPDSSWTT